MQVDFKIHNFTWISSLMKINRIIAEFLPENPFWVAFLSGETKEKWQFTFVFKEQKSYMESMWYMLSYHSWKSGWLIFAPILRVLYGLLPALSILYPTQLSLTLGIRDST